MYFALLEKAKAAIVYLKNVHLHLKIANVKIELK